MLYARAATRYAKSLLDLAREKGKVEEVDRDMKLFSQTLENNHELKVVISNPIVHGDKKLAILKELFFSRVDGLTFSIFDIVIRKGREGILYDIAKMFHRLYNVHKKITEMEVVAAQPLSEQNRKKIEQYAATLVEGTVELKQRVDEKLIAGFVLKIGDKQVDASVRSRINELKKELITNPYTVKI